MSKLKVENLRRGDVIKLSCEVRVDQITPIASSLGALNGVRDLAGLWFTVSHGPLKGTKAQATVEKSDRLELILRPRPTFIQAFMWVVCGKPYWEQV